MPQFAAAAVVAIKAAGAYVASATAATAAGTATLAQTAAMVAVNVAMSAAVSAGMALLQPKVGVGGSPTDWTANPDAPLAFPAGRVGVGGTIVHRDEFGPNNMYQTLVTVLGNAGPIKAIVSYSGDDQLVTFNGAGKAVSSQWANEMWQQYRLGNQPETAHTSPAGLTSGATLPGWSAADRISGAASVMMTMGENSKRSAYPTGEPKSIWTIEGLFAYDPRLDSTYPGGSGTCRLNNPATWVWTENPILWALKWLCGLWEGPTGKGAPFVDYQVGGIGMPITSINVAQYVEAANINDANGWKVSAWPTTDDDKIQVLDAFLQAGGAIYCSSAGKAGCIHRAGPRVAVATITREDTAGPIELETTASRITRINTIRPRFVSEADGWKLIAIPEVSAAAHVTEDAGRKRTRGIDFPYVRIANQAAQLSALQIANTRESHGGNVPLRSYYQNLQAGDAVIIDEPDFVLNGAKLLILDTDYVAEDGTHKIIFLSETDAKYPYALGQSTVAPSLPALTPVTPTIVSPPLPGEWALAAEMFEDNGSQVPALVVTGAVANAKAQAVLFEFRVAGAADWTAVTSEDPTAIRKEITGLTNGTSYEVAVSYRANGNVSTRLVLGPVVTGPKAPIDAGDFDTTPPAQPTGLILSLVRKIAADGAAVLEVVADWNDNADADLDGYETYWYADGVPYVSRKVANSRDVLVVPPGPDYYVAVYAMDKLGNRSLLQAQASTGATSGDTTPPATITGSYISAGPKLIAMGWVNPTDDDFNAVAIYRGTTNVVGAATLRQITSADWFTDTSVLPGTTYYYWGAAVDRSGNASAKAFIGVATARYIRRGDNDVAYNDPDLVTEYGNAATFAGQTRFATAATLSLADADISAPWTALDSRPALTQGDSLTEDNAMVDAAAWTFSGSQLYPAADGLWVGAITNNSNASGNFAGARTVPLNRSKTYIVEGYIYGQGPLSTAYGGVDLQNSAGTTISGDGSYWHYTAAGVQPPIGVNTYYSTVFGAGTSRPFPSNAVSMRVIGFPNYGSVVGCVHYFNNWRITEVVRIGGSLYRLDGTIATESQIVTSLGNAATFTGQVAVATSGLFSDIGGPTRPSDNAGTSGAWTVQGTYSIVQGNKVWKSGGTHGAAQGGAVGVPQVGSCFISGSILAAASGGGWTTYLCLDTQSAFRGNPTYFAYYAATGVGTGTVTLYAEGSGIGPFAVAGLTLDSRMMLYYDGAFVGLVIDGVTYATHPVQAGQQLWPKVLDFYNSIGSPAPSGIIDLQQGPYNNLGAATPFTLIPLMSGATTITGTGFRKVTNSGAWNGGVISRERYTGGATAGYTVTSTVPSIMVGLSSDAVPVDSYTTIDYAIYQSGVNLYAYQDGGSPSGPVATCAIGDKIWVTYDGVTARYYKSTPAGVTTEWYTSVGQTPGKTLYLQALAYGTGYDLRGLTFGPFRAAATIDGIWNAARTAQHGAAEVLTASGNAATYTGQTAWGTLTRSVVSISRIDDAGRITDGQALPLNGMSKSATLNPAYPFSAGGTPTTQIAVAASVATFAGGTTLSLPSATISGLTASTLYSIFRDLTAGTYVAISGSTTSYFTSAQRYMYIGTQATEEVGGGYEPLPPPPPGSGGGYGDIPLYVEP